MKKKSINTTRISSKDLAEAIFRPNKEKGEIQQETENSITVFTLTGQEDELTDETGQSKENGFPALWDIEHEDGSVESSEDEDNAYAKTSYNYGKRKFFIKENNRRTLMNPVGGLADSIQQERKQLKMLGKDKFKYREVGYHAFMLYLKFLKTKNNAYLIQAEREAM